MKSPDPSVARAQAAQLLQSSRALVLNGDRPMSERPAMKLALATLIVAASVFSTQTVEARSFFSSSRAQVSDSTSAREYGHNEALAVQQATEAEIVAINRVIIQPQSGFRGKQAFGALLGGIIGNKLGGGGSRSVRTLSTVAGAVGGGMVGKRLQGKNEKEGIEVFVRTFNGQRWSPNVVAVVQDADLDLQVGQRVFLVGSGEQVRIVPQGQGDNARLALDQQAADTGAIGAVSDRSEQAQPPNRTGVFGNIRDRLQGRRGNKAEEAPVEVEAPRRPRP